MARNRKHRVPRKENEESADSNRLRELGFEYNPPVDEYSYQPDSGGTIGGVRGKNEFGIAGGIAEDVDNKVAPLGLRGTRETVEKGEIDELGISEFMGHATTAPDVTPSKIPSSDIDRPDKDIRENIDLVLRTNTAIPSDRISVRVHDGAVVLKGKVKTVAQKLHVQEIVSAIPGVKRTINDLIF